MKKSVICPNCGAENENYGTCAFCGGRIPRPKPTQTEQEKGVADYVIPFKCTAEEVKAQFIKELIERDFVPTDVFESLEIKSISKKFVLMFYFEGTFDADWNCTQVERVERTRTVYDKEGKPKTESYYEEEYYPANGTAHGSFDFLAGEDDNLTQENGGFPKSAKPYSSKLLDDEAEIDTHGANESKIWKRLKVDVDSMANHAVMQQVPYRYKDLRYSVACNQSGNTRSILVPAWVIEYTYKDNSHVSTEREGFWDFNLPFDAAAEAESETLLGDMQLKKWSTYLPYILIVLAYLLFIHGVALPCVIDSSYLSIGACVVGGLLLGYYIIKSFNKYRKRIKDYNTEIDAFNLNLKKIDRDNKNCATMERAKGAANAFGISIDKYEALNVSGATHTAQPTPPRSLGKEILSVLIATLVVCAILCAITWGISIVEANKRAAIEAELAEQQRQQELEEAQRPDVVKLGFPSDTKVIAYGGNGESWRWYCVFDDNGMLEGIVYSSYGEVKCYTISQGRLKGLYIRQKDGYYSNYEERRYSFTYGKDKQTRVERGKEVSTEDDAVFAVNTDGYKSKVAIVEYDKLGYVSSMETPKSDDGGVVSIEVDTDFANVASRNKKRNDLVFHDPYKPISTSADEVKYVSPLIEFIIGKRIEMPRDYTVVSGTTERPKKIDMRYTFYEILYKGTSELQSLESNDEAIRLFRQYTKKPSEVVAEEATAEEEVAAEEVAGDEYADEEEAAVEEAPAYEEEEDVLPAERP